MKKIYTLLLIFILSTSYSQQGFGTSNPAPSSVIDMVSSNKGTLLPRITLTSTAVAAPVTAPANALTVFNTATTGDVTPGYYYWNLDTVTPANSKWIRLMDSNTPIVEADGVIGNEVTDATANGGLVRSGSGTSASPYTLGLPTTGTTGQTMVWNGTAWAPTYLSTVLAGCDGLDATPTNYTISSINGTATIQILTTKSFTITRKSLVTFSYNIAVNSVLTSSGANITDGAAKLMGARITWSSLPGGSPFTVGNVISADAVPYSNNWGGNYTFGTFYLNGDRSIVLNAGTYGVNLSGYVFTQDNGQGIRGTFNGGTDQFDIIAVPIQ